jgi:hypothetical protein
MNICHASIAAIDSAGCGFVISFLRHPTEVGVQAINRIHKLAAV